MIFLFSGTKVATHAAFVKGRFTLRVKNLLCSLRSCGIFYPSPLTNTLCFAGRCLGKRKKCCSLAGCPFCHSVTGICPHGGRPAPISRTRNIILSLPASCFYGVTLRYRFLFDRYANARSPPAKTPPEAIIESLCIISTKCGNDTQITVLQ